MVYTKQTWTDLPSETTPISAARLAHIETQYDEVVSALADPDSDISNALRPFAFKDSDGTPWEVNDTLVGGDSGWWNLKATNTTGYVWHLSSSAGFTGSGLIGLGVDVGGTVGLTVSQKTSSGAHGIYLDNQSTNNSGAVSWAFYGKQSSPTSALMYLKSAASGVAPLLVLDADTAGSSQILATQTLPDDTAAWNSYANSGRSEQFTPARFAGSRTTDAGWVFERQSGGSENLHAYHYTGTPTTFYRFAMRVGVSGASDEWKFSLAGTGATVDGSETYADMIRIRRNGSVDEMSFFGVATSPQRGAYTQTYSTSAKVTPNMTANTVVTTTPTTSAYGYTLAQATAIITELNALRADVISTKNNLTAVIDDLQAFGLVG